MNQSNCFRIRFFAFVLLSVLFCVTAQAQNARGVTVDIENATIKELFKIIEHQTSYHFSYREDVLDNRRDVTIHVKDAPVAKVLDSAFKGRNLSFNILSDKTIVVSDGRSKGNTASNRQTIIEGTVYDPDGEPVVGTTVRARAYGVSPDQTSKYPAFTKQTQDVMRNQIRVERRMEFAKEGLRYTDMIRWKQAEKVMNRKIYGILYPAEDAIKALIDTGDWLWPFAPKIDDDGCPDFTALEATGKYRVISSRSWDNRMYLWPMPTTEIQINKNMKQNPDY